MVDQKCRHDKWVLYAEKKRCAVQNHDLRRIYDEGGRGMLRHIKVWRGGTLYD
jgi:hypothetical protein